MKHIADYRNRVFWGVGVGSTGGDFSSSLSAFHKNAHISRWTQHVQSFSLIYIRLSWRELLSVARPCGEIGTGIGNPASLCSISTHPLFIWQCVGPSKRKWNSTQRKWKENSLSLFLIRKSAPSSVCMKRLLLFIQCSKEMFNGFSQWVTCQVLMYHPPY